MKIVVGLFILVMFLGLVSAQEYEDTCRVYDNFSSNVLNLSRWNEYSNIGFTDEHFVDASEGVYHVKQNIEGDRETNLQPKRQFVSGESFFYKAIYNGGSGNHFSQPLINGNYPPTQLESCDASGGCGPIGFWNGIPDLGAQIGIYNINFEFFSNQVKMTAVRPDNTTVVNTFTGNSEPYNLTINTHTGHNGLLHFDYDNFIICTCSNDLDSDGSISMSDLTILLLNWGFSGAGDVDGDGIVGFSDLTELLLSWGPCQTGVSQVESVELPKEAEQLVRKHFGKNIPQEVEKVLTEQFGKTEMKVQTPSRVAFSPSLTSDKAVFPIALATGIIGIFAVVYFLKGK